MIVEVLKGQELWPKYDGWFVTALREEVNSWEARAIVPDAAYSKISKDSLRAEPGMSVAAARHYFVWKPEPEVNEWGPVSP